MKSANLFRDLAGKGAIYQVHTVPKLLLFVALGLVFFIHDPRKIIFFGILILSLCFWEYPEFLKHPWRILFVTLVLLGSTLYNWQAGQLYVEIVFSGVRLALVVLLGFLAEDAVSDRELRILAGARFAPLLIGALVGVQRIGGIYRGIIWAQQVRGIEAGWSLRKQYLAFSYRGYALLVSLLRLNEVVHYQFILRGYRRFRSGSMLLRKPSLADFIAFILAGVLVVTAVVPWDSLWVLSF